jgi:hypothetical protein
MQILLYGIKKAISHLWNSKDHLIAYELFLIFFKLQM